MVMMALLMAYTALWCLETLTFSLTAANAPLLVALVLSLAALCVASWSVWNDDEDEQEEPQPMPITPAARPAPLTPHAPTDATLEVALTVSPNAHVLFADADDAEPADMTDLAQALLRSYDAERNAGIATADGEGHVVLKLRAKTQRVVYVEMDAEGLKRPIVAVVGRSIAVNA